MLWELCSKCSDKRIVLVRRKSALVLDVESDFLDRIQQKSVGYGNPTYEIFLTVGQVSIPARAFKMTERKVELSVNTSWK